MNILGFIPARSGSKGVPDKNIKPIKCVPLLEFSVFTAMKAKEYGFLSEVLVSTDSDYYLSLVSDYGIEQGYLRPASLASDTSPTIDAVLHVLEWYRDRKGVTFDAVMTLQPTSPFRTPRHIEQAIRLMEGTPQATCVASISKLGDHHPMRIKRFEKGVRLVDFCDEHVEPEPSRRQDFKPDAYVRNGAIYLTRTKTLLEDSLIRGPWVAGMIMPDANSINVDEHMDYVIARAALEYERFSDELSFFRELFSKRDLE